MSPPNLIATSFFNSPSTKMGSHGADVDDHVPNSTTGSVHAFPPPPYPTPAQDSSQQLRPSSNDTVLDANGSLEDQVVSRGLRLLEARSVHWYSYLATADFWLVAAIGQILALCITATNTFTSFLSAASFHAPAFQTSFNYALLMLVYNGLFLFHDGPRAWCRVAFRDGWKYLIMAFLDVEGNYFTVLAYEYTNILSAQLINFWSIVCVVLISFLLLRVRYRLPQLLGILLCCGGMGILLASDHITGSNGGSNGGPAPNMLKGDLLALLGATLYGTSNVLEEWLVSRAPIHHVLGFLGLLGMLISGTQTAIFDRDTLAATHWDGEVVGWLMGYTLCLFLFYTLAPLILRMASAAFFDISLLTANFWGVIIGIRVFGYSVHFMYPLAFVCITLGLVLYFLTGSILGDSQKPWLGQLQEAGVTGVGTAKLKAINAARLDEACSEGTEGVFASGPHRIQINILNRIRCLFSGKS